MLVGLFALTLGAFGQRIFQPLGTQVSQPAPVAIDHYLAERLATVPERLSSVETELRALSRRIEQLEDQRSGRRAYAERPK
jgi:hypothetical protein